MGIFKVRSDSDENRLDTSFGGIFEEHESVSYAGSIAEADAILDNR